MISCPHEYLKKSELNWSTTVETHCFYHVSCGVPSQSSVFKYCTSRSGMLCGRQNLLARRLLCSRLPYCFCLFRKKYGVILRGLGRVCTMNDSRVIVLGIRAEKAAQGRVLGLLKTFLDYFQRDERTETRGGAPIPKNSNGVLST